MHSLLLISANDREITVDALRRAFEASAKFTDVRFDTPAGTPIEATYHDGEDFTTVRLSSTRTAISIRGTSGAALSAAWILKNQLNIPLRMVDTDYSFDLTLVDFKSLEDVQLAIDRARAS
ncbi:MAG: hypothetical protein AB7O59_13900 [Pirellulales bacterium]